MVPRDFLFSWGGVHIFGNVKFKKFEFFRGNFPAPPPYYSRSAHYIRVCPHKLYANYRSQDHNIYMYNEQSVALLIVCILKFTLYHNVFKSCDFYEVKFNLEILRTKSRMSYLKESIGMIIGFYNNKNGLFFLRNLKR